MYGRSESQSCSGSTLARNEPDSSRPTPVPYEFFPVPGNSNHEADELFEKGFAHYQSNQFREAMTALQTALELYRNDGNHRGVDQTLKSLGLVNHNRKNDEQTISFHLQTLALAHEIKDPSVKATSLSHRYGRSVRQHTS